jgi:hypothetical protein
VFCLSLQRLSETFLTLKNSARYHKCTQVFMWSARYFCPVLMKLEFSRQIFEKYSNMKFHENPSSGSRVVPCGRADGQMWRSQWSLFVTFRNFANAPNKM